MGSLDALSREFARAHSERLWKQLVIAPDPADESAKTVSVETFVVLGLAIAAALAIKVPALFGLRRSMPAAGRSTRGTPACSSCRCSPFISSGSAGRTLVTGLWLALPFAAGAVFANVYPFRAPSSTLSC